MGRFVEEENGDAVWGSGKRGTTKKLKKNQKKKKYEKKIKKKKQKKFVL